MASCHRNDNENNRKEGSMNITLQVSEIVSLVEKKFKVKPQIETIDNKSIKVSYAPAAFLPAVSLTLRIDALYGNLLKMSYDCNMATAMLISGSISYLEEKLPKGVTVDTDKKQVEIDLTRIEQLGKVLEYVVLDNVYFATGEVVVTFTMR